MADDVNADTPADTPVATAGWRDRRRARWDRPPAPRDWRFWVGGFGRVLIVLGLLLFGFVGYQLWGTGIETARNQNRLRDEFTALVAATPATTATPATAPTIPSTTASTSTTSPTASSTTAPTAPAPVTTAPPVTAPPATLAPVRRSEPLALLEIPAIGKVGNDALVVVPGVGLDDLQAGPGHYPDTPLPGQLGNAAIAGHRTTWGEPFRHVDELVPGDEVRVTMTNGERFVYVVTSTEIVSPSDYDVVRTSDPTTATLTLTSCHPAFSARQRIVVHTVLDVTRSPAPADPTYYELDPVSSSVSDATPGATGDDPVVVPDEEPAGAPVLDAPAVDATGDAFVKGWFHDTAAFPHILGWGALCAAIAYGAYRLSRRFRSHLIGWSVAVVPFVVTLYFFYQNVNRLLPPGL